jgi:hypothetical protein
LVATSVRVGCCRSPYRDSIPFVVVCRFFIAPLQLFNASGAASCSATFTTVSRSVGVFIEADFVLVSLSANCIFTIFVGDA